MSEPRGTKVKPSRFPGLMIFFLVALVLLPEPGRAQNQEVVITRLGLSQVRGTSLLTIILNRAATPRITPVPDSRTPQLLIDFPQARLAEVPQQQPGDYELVQQIRLATLNGGRGVRIILDLVPDRPYVYWRLLRDNPAGGVAFLVGLRPDQRGSQAQIPQAAGERLTSSQQQPPEPSSPPTSPPPSLSREGQTWQWSSGAGQPSTPALREIAQAVPQSGPALAFLEQQGWKVEEQNQLHRTGNRPGRRLILTNSRYPDLEVQVETLAAQAAGGPTICRLALTTASHDSDEARKYRDMRRWNLATIKKHYEDIGDYYDDGLKPLRLILREQTKAVLLRHFEVVRQFLTAAVPQNPQLPDTVLKHLQEKVNKRLEGVQYTENTDPLVIFDLVDFYTLRLYFVGR